MILGKNFKFYKIEIFSGIVIATPASQLQCPFMLAGNAIATPASQLRRRPDCIIAFKMTELWPHSVPELFITRIARPYRGLANLAAPQGFASLRYATLRFAPRSLFK